MKKILLIVLTIIVSNQINAQNCASPDNIYHFVYNNKSYEIVKQNKTWTDAAACAVERGGYLAEIDDEDEQNQLYHHVKNVAGINPVNTIAPDGGGASYIWLGGNDIAEEGKWIWDGNNDGDGPQFWQGTTSGVPVGGLYNNWGNEPDNWSNQDGLGLAITDWPLGTSGQWNDVDDGNDLYFIIEYDEVLGVNESIEDEGFIMNPNPAKDLVMLKTSESSGIIKNITVINSAGSKVLIKDFPNNTKNHVFSLQQFDPGMYIVQVTTERNTFFKKLIKK